MLKNLEERINTIQLPPSKPNPFETLTETEFDVMELLIRGCGNLEIAEIQYTSKNTVRTHIKHIYSKLGVLGKDRHGKDGKATILYMIYHPKSFLDSYTKEELKNVKLIDNLTPRQLSVLEYYAMGFSYKKIADKLKISKNTVKNSHLFNIFYKLYLEEKDAHKKNIKAMRLYILRHPEIIHHKPSKNPQLLCFSIPQQFLKKRQYSSIYGKRKKEQGHFFNSRRFTSLGKTS
ncbi:unnamed protein product [marine sediment metagenome]|uniref:HTH luxR-type domain-containing protein n=1 Tax=marine sediment metagenome TaxID=412755 RepID=X1R080_9ZZZZ